MGAALSKLGSLLGRDRPEPVRLLGLMVWAHQQQGKTIPRTRRPELAGGTPSRATCSRATSSATTR